MAENDNIPCTKEEIDELCELYAKSTKVVAWYSHYPGEVRGPFCRWLKVTEVDDQYKKHVAEIGDESRYAAAAMNNLPRLIVNIKQLEKRVAELELALAIEDELREK
jgi:hypothetical protein